jgi:hypothetical protein
VVLVGCRASTDIDCSTDVICFQGTVASPRSIIHRPDPGVLSNRTAAGKALLNSQGVRCTLNQHDTKISHLEEIPLDIRGLSLLVGFYFLLMHFPILLNGIFPLFGHFLTWLDGVFAWDILIIALSKCTWGLFKMKRWAWCGSLLSFVLKTISTTMTSAQHNLEDILTLINLPHVEMEWFQGVPLLTVR